MSTNTIAVRRPLVLADLVPGAVWVRDVLLVLCAAGITGALAQASVHIPGTPVPITGQTLGVLLSGCALGWRRAGAAMGLYVGAGFLGVPWFAAGGHGYVGYDAGYLFGFLLAGLACGYAAERGASRSVFGCLPAMILGEVAIYLIGVPWLAVSLHLSVAKAISEGFTPFLAGDAIKAAIGAGLLPLTWRLSTRRPEG